MINTLKIFNDLKQTMDPTAAEKIVDVITSVYEELQNSVTKTEFNELKEIVKELAERVNVLTMRMDELTQRMDELTQRVQDLVGEMKGIKVTIQDMRQEIGGMSHAIGYGLEDQSYLTLPPILKRDHAITLKGRLKRGFLETARNKYIEINIWGQGEREGKSIEIIGEAKTQLKKRDVDKFLQTLQAIRPHIDHSIHPICVTYQTSPAVTQYAKDKGITLYFTYELQSG